MITLTSGDILQADAEAIVNTVNCVGVMGRGIALQFKKAWPKNFEAYAEACKNEEVQPGKMFVYNTGQLANPKFIINFPTKRHWRGASRIEDIVAGLEDLIEVVKEQQIKSIALPPLGSGLGGLDWLTVRVQIESAVSSLDDAVQVTIYEPTGAPDSAQMAKNRKVPKITAGRAVLVELMQRYLSGLLDPAISLLELHKLMYFMQEAGEPLKLKYAKASYGPYAENLRHVLNDIEGHMISGYADGGDTPGKTLQLVPGAVEESKKFLENREKTRERFERVSSLVEGFESPFGLELLATVHWLCVHDGVVNKEQVVEQTYNWGERKRKFTQRQIELAYEVLQGQRWLTV